MTKMKVAVLMGGTSSERDISLSTGRQILQALDNSKYEVYALDTMSGQRFLPASELEQLGVTALVSADGLQQIEAAANLSLVDVSNRPDVAIVALHGKGGEDGSIQGLLEIMGIPYTGSGILASALALDKARCKTFLSAHGVRVPKGLVISKGHHIPNHIDPPVVVKPNSLGSSDGVTIVRNGDDFRAAVEAAFELDDTVLVEEFIEGVEVTGAVLGNTELEALPLVEIVAASGFYDRHDKYTPGASEHICPARISPELTIACQEAALRCHRALGCKGVSRTDLLVTPDGSVYALEVNTIPGMTPMSLVPIAAAEAGYSFTQLLDKLVALALDKN